MAIDVSVGTHAMSGVSKLLATSGGAHIYNVVLTTAADNGNIIGRGAALTAFDNYAETTPTTFKGKIVWKAVDGNWYVEVVEAENALLVYNAPVSPYAEPSLKSEKIFFVDKGEVARAHELKVGDIFELSDEGFTGTPAIGAEIETITAKKLVISE